MAWLVKGAGFCAMAVEVSAIRMAKSASSRPEIGRIPVPFLKVK
jgi:hypothetical protein